VVVFLRIAFRMKANQLPVPIAMTPEQTQEIIQWRERKLSPKEIARQMGLRPAEVTNFLRTSSENAHQERLAKGELPQLVGCFVNQNAAVQLLQHKPKGWLKRVLPEEHTGNGFAQVFVIRQDQNKYLIAGFLIDYWCLGVKDALFRKGDRQLYEDILARSRHTFAQDFIEISFEQAQALVFGALDYAAGLGFQPHRDFVEAQKNLGPRLENLSPIVFGKDGQPFYVSGPYDNPRKILQILTENVGEGNFHYLLNVG
jgi:hypothetical protein